MNTDVAEVEVQPPVPLVENVTMLNVDTLHRRGIPLQEYVAQEQSDQSIANLLRLALEQHPRLSGVEIQLISPEQEPDTGGLFHAVQIDKDHQVPTISIVTKDNQHLEQLFKNRRTSVEAVATLLGIKPEDMTPDLLRSFIIAHELGHASDYFTNYVTEDAQDKASAGENWFIDYDLNLIVLPVSGLDPAKLRSRLARYSSLENFIGAYPQVRAYIEEKGITSLEGLQQAQERAYKESTFEQYADTFATDFLKKNAQVLGIKIAA